MFELELEIPEGTAATVELPDGSTREVAAGLHTLTCPR
jgi:hypothetical protein